MNVTPKKLALVSLLLAVCVAANLLLAFGNQKAGEDGPQAETYYLTNYTGPDALMMVSIENATGEVVLANAQGTYLIAPDRGLAADAGEAAALFEGACKLPLERLLEGASADDPQYGLTDPGATVLLQDINEAGLIFLIGSQTPDGAAYYVCLSGDKRVFLMSRSHAELFLGEITQYYDLSLYPSLEGDGLSQLQSITLRREGRTVYRLEQVAVSETGQLAYFALTEPFRLLLGTEQLNTQLLIPLRTLKPAKLIPEPEELAALGLGDGAPTLSLTFRDGRQVTLRIGTGDGALTPVMAEESGLVIAVPTSYLTFAGHTLTDLVGTELLSLNINAIRSVVLNGKSCTVDQDLVTALNQISIQGTCSPAESPGRQILTAEIQTVLGDEQIRLSFYEADSRKYSIAVDGKLAFWCSPAAIQPLLSYADAA